MVARRPPVLLGRRSRGLLCDGEAAERVYREAIEHLGRTRLRAELARAHLLKKVFTKLGISSRRGCTMRCPAPDAEAAPV